MTSHLGGHLWTTHVDEGVLKLLKRKGCLSLLDVGCGPAGNVIEARKLGFTAYGIDGDPALQSINQTECIILPHDYTHGPVPMRYLWGENQTIDVSGFDVALSTEFLEHVNEQYIPFIMDTFMRCKLVVCTHALPGEDKGHHHVTLKPEEWWITKFAEYGFRYLPEATADLREASTMRKNFMRKTGKVFFRD